MQFCKFADDNNFQPCDSDCRFSLQTLEHITSVYQLETVCAKKVTQIFLKAQCGKPL